MSVFSITDSFVQGDTGLKCDLGVTGPEGVTGEQGSWGWTGPDGFIGLQGLTGLSETGIEGFQGETGVYLDPDILLYLKFKTTDNKQTDFSSYERDCVFEYTGVLDDLGNPLSYFIRESGVIDYCHNVVHNGGSVYYRRNEFLPFGGETGTISCWIKLTQKPIANFTYSVDPDNSLRIIFRDASTKQPTSWTWWMDYSNVYQDQEQGFVMTIQNPIYTFSVTGTYIVKLRVENVNGYTDIAKFITV
jgi:hypothetical protein